MGLIIAGEASSGGVMEYRSIGVMRAHFSMTPLLQLLNMHQAEIIVLLLTAVGVLAVLAHKIALSSGADLSCGVVHIVA
jgi:hypothetical protein